MNERDLLATLTRDLSDANEIADALDVKPSTDPGWLAMRRDVDLMRRAAARALGRMARASVAG